MGNDDDAHEGTKPKREGGKKDGLLPTPLAHIHPVPCEKKKAAVAAGSNRNNIYVHTWLRRYF